VLKTIKILFEIGLWEIAELPQFLELIHAKLQLLFCEENEFGDDFKPDENETGSAYNPFYHEMIACIINQATMLHNDEAYMNVFVETTAKGRIIPPLERVKNSITRVYFNKKDSFNRMCFALFDGILHSLKPFDPSNDGLDGSKGNAPKPLHPQLREKEMFASRTTFMNLFDINYDLFLLSTAGLTEDKIEKYDKLKLDLIMDDKNVQSDTNIKKIDKCRNSMLYILKQIKTGELVLDPAVRWANPNRDAPANEKNSDILSDKFQNNIDAFKLIHDSFTN
jgi:hypothetical protein